MGYDGAESWATIKESPYTMKSSTHTKIPMYLEINAPVGCNVVHLAPNKAAVRIHGCCQRRAQYDVVKMILPHPS